MADEKKKATTDEQAAKAKPVEAPVESTYTRAEHIANASAMYGAPRHVVAGAFAVIDEKAKGDPKEDFAKSEVKEAIARFQRRDITKEH
jgi:hypothetical protein